MSRTELTLLTKDKYELSFLLYEAKTAKASVLMIHGMEEHKERYDEFANYLSERGYNVLVADLRGHGKNAPLLSHIADKDGDKLIVEDQRELTNFLKEKYPNLPVIIFAHSMGTIITRNLMQEDSKNYHKVVMSGYVNPNPASGVGLALTKFIKLFKKAKGHSKMIDGLAVGQFAKAVKNRKTNLDWLSYDENNVKKYIEDPLCGVPFTLGSYVTLFSLMKKMGKPKLHKDVNETMPILLIGGKDDPCTGYEKGRKASLTNLNKAGYRNISVITLDNMRHEILNETKKDLVMKEIYNFLEK